MATYTKEQLAVIVRNRLGLAASARPAIEAQVDALTQAVARSAAANEQTRRHVLTAPALTQLNLVAGVGDLSVVVASNRVLLDLFDLGVVTHANLTYPLRRVATAAQGATPGFLDALFARYWIVGDKLHTKGLDGNALAGPLSLAVPYWPTLGQMPDALVDAPEWGLLDALTRSAATLAGGE